MCFGKFVETFCIHGVCGIFSEMLDADVRVVRCGFVSSKGCGGEVPRQFSSRFSLEDNIRGVVLPWYSGYIVKQE